MKLVGFWARAWTRCTTGMDLRFPSNEESAFQRYLQPALVQYSCLSAGCLTVIFAIFLLREALRGDDPLELSKMELRTLTFAFSAGQLVLFSSVFVLCLLRILLGWMKDLDWEAIVLVVILLVLQQPILGRPSMLPFWCNVASGDCRSADVTNAEHLGTEIWNLGIIEMAITAVQLFLPIRSRRGWCVGVVATGEYTFCALYAAAKGTYILPLSASMSIVGPLVVLVLFAYFGGRFNERQNRANWQKTQGRLLQTQDQLDQQQLAMSRILSRLCDSLVHLGSSFEIIQPCPQLDALLFRHKSQGRNFCDFIASDSSKVLFTNQLRRPALQGERATAEADGGGAGMMNLSLWDSNGEVVKVYAHHACFHASDGATQYLLGLVETGERPAPMPARQDQVVQPVALPELSGELGMVVATDEEGEFVIKSMKPSMNSLFSEVAEGDPVESICDENQRRRLLAWMQHHCNAAAEMGTPVRSTIDGCFTARPRHGDTVLYRATLRGVFTRGEEGDRVKLSFSAPNEPSSRSSRRSSWSGSHSMSSRSRSRCSSRSSLGRAGISDYSGGGPSVRSARLTPRLGVHGASKISM